MSITLEASGTVATATSGASNPITCSPAFPGGYTKTTGHYAVVVAVSRHDTEDTPTITSSPQWNQEPGISASGGGGTFGAGTGPARITVFVRRIDSGDAAPTVSLAGTNTGRTLQAVMFILSTTSDYLRFAYSFQAEATAGTAWSEAYTQANGMHIKSGDFLFTLYGVRDDQHASFTAMGISATGATISAVTERADAITGNGNDQGIGVGTTTCTAGASTANPTVTATIGTSETGMTGVLRVREFTDGSTPNLIDFYPTLYSSSGATKVSKSFEVKTGDVLVVGGAAADTDDTIDSVSGGSLTWTSQENISTAGDVAALRVWTATVDADKNMSVTVNYTPSVNNELEGQTVVHFSNSDGIGAAESEHVATEAPSLAITTLQANSALVWYSADWSAQDGASRTWRTINSITPAASNGLEALYFRDVSWYTCYVGIWNDAGATGSKTAGLSAPTGQNTSQAVIEVKGPAAGQSVEIVQVTESGTVQTLNVPAKSVTVVQITETGTVQAIGGQKTLVLVQITETGEIFTVTPAKSLGLTPIEETGIVQAITTGGQSVNVEQITEDGTVQAISVAKAVAIEQITETSVVQTISVLKSLGIEQIVEVGVTQPLGWIKSITLEQILETGLVQGVSSVKSVPVVQVTETGLVQAVQVLKSLLPVVETGEVFVITPTGGTPPAPSGDGEYLTPLWQELLGLRLKRR